MSHNGYVRLVGHAVFTVDFCHANDLRSEGTEEHRCGCAPLRPGRALLTDAAVSEV